MNTENYYRETDLGNISIHLCGEYDPQRAYEYLDAVEFGGGSYICAIEYGKTITGIAPEPTKNTEYWHINSIPGTLTPEYIAMHDRVVNLSEQVEADAEEVRTAEQNVSGMELNVTQMQEQTRQSAEAAEQSKDSAAGYAASADASRQAAAESKQNIDAQVTGFDSHVAEKTEEAENDIEAVRIAANKAIIAQQEQSVNEVTRAGIEAISTAQAAAQTATEKAQAAATSEKNAAASEAAAKLSEENATKMAGQVATDKEQVANDRTAVEKAKQEMTESVAQIEQNTQGISELKSDLVGYKIGEKILTKGDESGWYSINENTIIENTHQTWTRTHLIAPFGFNGLRFEIKDYINCVYTIKNDGRIDIFNIVGKYDIDITDCSDVYINFFGNTLVSDYYLYYFYKPYESGYIHFQVTVNQKQVLANDVANELLDTESIALVTCHLKLPTTYRPYGKKTKLLMICHGAGRGVTIPHPTDNETWEDIPSYNSLVDTFVDAGYAVFDCNGYKDDFSGCNFWGAHRGIECWRQAYNYIVKNYNVEESVSIYGFSMGGLTALNLVMNGFPNVKVVALGSPVLDTQKAFENGQAVIMGTAYGMGDIWEPIKARGCSPIERIVTIGDTEMVLQNLPPIKIWYGSTEQDEIVNKNYASRFVNAIINAGGYATYREVEGENHRICFGAVQYINNEYLYWINRFNN